jgi:hypothetical protein
MEMVVATGCNGLHRMETPVPAVRNGLRQTERSIAAVRNGLHCPATPVAELRSYFSNWAACSLVSTFLITFSITPFSSIKNVVRTVPM